MMDPIDNLLDGLIGNPTPTQRIRVAQSLISAISDHLYVVDTAGRYLYISPNAAEAFQKPATEMTGKTWQELGFPPEIMGPIERDYQTVIDSKQHIVGVSIFPLQGRDHYYRYSLVPILGDDGEAVAVASAVSEVTDHFVLEQELHETHVRVNDLLDSIVDGLYSLDENYCFTYVNDTAETLLGKREGILGKSFYELFPDRVETAGFLALKQAKIDKIAAHFPVYHPKASKWFDCRAYPTRSGVAVYYRDITSAKLAEESTQRLAAIVESTSDAIYGKDLNGVILSWNGGAEALYGYSATEAIGQSVDMLVPVDHKDKIFAILERLRAGEKIETHDTLRRRKDGSLVNVSLTITPLFDSEGKPVGASSIARNIDERKRIETALKLSEETVRLTIDAAQMGTWEIDLATRKVNESEQMPLLYGLPQGYATDALEYRMSLIHPDDASIVPDALRNAVEDGEDYRTEYRVNGADGRLRWLASRGKVIPDEHGKAARVLGVTMDITERKASEQALAAALIREHNIAATLQRSLLQMPPADAFPGLDIATLYESATTDMEVGGDFMDAFPIDDTRVALVVGDVSGKGLAAAARTAEIKYTLRAFLRESGDPGAAMHRLNVFLTNGHALEKQDFVGFVALTLSVFDTRTGAVQIALGGTEPPVIVRQSGESHIAPVQGMPLGIVADAEYDPVNIIMQSGDLLVMTTDGFTESRRDGLFFGIEGVQRSAIQNRTLTALPQIADACLAAARKFSGGTLTDDACLLVARRV